MRGLELNEVTASYGRAEALLEVNLRILPGEMLAVLGANGAGKSTLVAVTAGLHRVEAGQVRVAGVDMLRDPSRARRELGVAGQHVALYPSETLRANLRLFGALAGLGGRDLASRTAEVAAAIGISEALDRRADHCSAGQRRRAHVAAALLHDPAVVVLDEPAAHLDPAGRRDLRGLAQQAVGRGAAVCWCTNDPDEAALVGDRVAILERGRLLVEGGAAELVQRLVRPTVEVLFTGSAPALDPRPGVEVSGSMLRVAVSNVATALPEALAVIGDHSDRVRSVRVLEPDLATAFSALTRCRSEGDEAAALVAEVAP